MALQLEKRGRPLLLGNVDEINEVIVHYIISKREELCLPVNSPALLILDVFRGQMTQQVTSLLAEKKPSYIFVRKWLG